MDLKLEMDRREMKWIFLDFPGAFDGMKSEMTFIDC